MEVFPPNKEIDEAQSLTSKEKSLQNLEQKNSEQSKKFMFTKQCLMKIVQALANIDEDFSDLILNFSQRQNVNSFLKERFCMDMEKVAKTTIAVDLVEKLKNIFKNIKEGLEENNILDIFCESFLGFQEKNLINDNKLDLQKMMTTLFQTIEEGLVVGKNQEAERFHHIFWRNKE